MNKHLRTAEILANLLDNRFKLFGIRFGLSAIIGLLPEIGDMIDAFMSLYLVWIAVQLKVPSGKIAQMLVNIGINFVIGLVPVLGDATYVLRRGNLRNLKIIQDFVANEGAMATSNSAIRPTSISRVSSGASS
jgi:hypothetical protein